jgi:hypothetical protein
VGGIDLYTLFTKVAEKGGYDRVSATDKGSSNWRAICRDLGPKWKEKEYLSFEVKEIYLNNLA